MHKDYDKEHPSDSFVFNYNEPLMDLDGLGPFSEGVYESDELVPGDLPGLFHKNLKSDTEPLKLHFAVNSALFAVHAVKSLLDLPEISDEYLLLLLLLN